MGEYKFNVRNTDNTDWVNLLTDINVDLDPNGVAASQFASSVLDEVLVELKGLTGGGGPGYAGEPVHIVNTLDVVSSVDEAGSFSTRGGAAIAKSVFIGNTLTVELDTDATATTDGALNVAGGVGIQKSLFVGTGITGNLTGDLEALVTNAVAIVTTGDLTVGTNGFVTGDFTVTGDIIGDVLADTLTVTTVISDLIPDPTLNLGGVGTEWANVYANNMESSIATITTLNATTINSATFSGSFNGNFNGNLSGDVAGDVTGNLNGDLIAPITNAGEVVTTGDLTIGNDGFVTGDLTVTGSIIGGGVGAPVPWTAVPSHIVPDTQGAYDVGSAISWWRNIYSTHLTTTNGGASLTVPLTISDTTDATDKDTGALVVEGGVGIEKDLYVGGSIFMEGTLEGDYSGTFTGDVIGDLNGDLIKGSTVYLNNPTPSTGLGTGALVISTGTPGPTGAGLSVEGNLYVGGTIFGDGAGGGGGVPEWTTATEGLVVEANKFYFVPTGVVNLTLPATPTAGDTVKFKDFDGTWGSANCIVDPNGENINGLANNLVMNVTDGVFELVFTTAQGWKTI